jgi:hypothetical protein
MRTILQEDRVTEQLESLKVDYERLDEAFLWVNAALCKSPQIFPVIPGTLISRIRLRDFPGVPNLCIFFRYDDNTVYLLSAELIEVEE